MPAAAVKNARSEQCSASFDSTLKTPRKPCVPGSVAPSGFCGYCAITPHKGDFLGLIPAVRQYRHAALPKGIEDSALQRALSAIDTETHIGARDYAIFLLMMAYGIRGISVAHLLLDDIDWPHSRIRIRAQKGGKEVMLPLMESVGEALIQYPNTDRLEPHSGKFS